jgi:hypothetical protein
MAGNRKAAEAVILKRIEQMSPGGSTVQIYRDLFAKMDDPAFDAFMKKLKSREQRLVLLAPNVLRSTGDKAPASRIEVERAIALAEEMGHDFYQRIWINPGDGKTPAFLTNKKYLVLLLPYRRQAQLLEKKARIPKHNRSLDAATGQVTGESKGSKLSSPEIQVLAALDLPKMITEQIKFRGGDVKGYDAMVNMIDKTGAVSMDAIEHLAGGVESTKTVATYLNAMHLSTTLV